MEQTTSSRYLPFMERPMVVQTFAPSRHLGIQAEYAKHWWRASFGVFFQAIDNLETSTFVADNNKDYGRNQGMSYTGKVNFMPFSDDRTMGLHFGIAGSYRTRKQMLIRKISGEAASVAETVLLLIVKNTWIPT